MRGRLGYAADRFMPYVTGGLAVGDIKASLPGFAGGSATNVGWTAGGGIEFAIAGHWTAKAEYLYVDLGHFSCGIACGAHHAERIVQRQPVPRRHQLPLLSAPRATTASKTPGLAPWGFCLQQL